MEAHGIVTDYQLTPLGEPRPPLLDRTLQSEVEKPGTYKRGWTREKLVIDGDSQVCHNPSRRTLSMRPRP